MGDRYILTVTCPQCGVLDDDVYYAPTCGFTEHKCVCGHVTDLEQLTGISYEDASNRADIEVLCKQAAEGEGAAKTCLSCGLEFRERGYCGCLDSEEC